jgi:inner membrane protein
VFLVAHIGFTAAPGAIVARWWGENRGFIARTPDLRWLLAGTVLPDVVDKSVGQVFFKPYFQNGRIFAHTFLLAIFLFLAGTYDQKRRGDSRILLLAFGVASHMLLDRIWIEPTTALWPSLGPFMRHPSIKSLFDQISDYVRDPIFWTSEIMGAFLLVSSLRYLGIKRLSDIKRFILTGRAPYLAQFEPDYSG